jgi:hypothetical protein
MKHLSRRTFLKGMGTSVALPFLDAMSPAFAAGAARPARTVFVYAPTGMEMQYWAPNAVGKDFDFPRILKPLEPVKDDVLLISGLVQNPGRAGGDGAGDHARAVASYLTATRPKKTEGLDIRCGKSIDQVLADSIGAGTRFPSLQLTCEDSRQLGACDSYSCVYQNISWRSETQALVPDVNPRLIFERLFGSSDPAESAASRAHRKIDQKSILDFVRDETASLQSSLGPTDRRKVDEYLQSVREIELRIATAEKQAIEAPPGLRQPAGIPLVYAEHARLIFDLLLAALQTDSTRVATFMLAREGGLKNYPEVGVPEAHHSITHHRNQPDLVEKCAKVNCYHMEQFAYFVRKMKTASDGDGSLLDHSVVVYGSGLADPNRHEHANLPTLIAGTAGGKLKPGRHLKLTKEAPMANLWISLAGMCTVPCEKLGDSTGDLPELIGL